MLQHSAAPGSYSHSSNLRCATDVLSGEDHGLQAWVACHSTVLYEGIIRLPVECMFYSLVSATLRN